MVLLLLVVLLPLAQELVGVVLVAVPLLQRFQAVAGVVLVVEVVVEL